MTTKYSLPAKSPSTSQLSDEPSSDIILVTIVPSLSNTSYSTPQSNTSSAMSSASTRHHFYLAPLYNQRVKTLAGITYNWYPSTDPYVQQIVREPADLNDSMDSCFLGSMGKPPPATELSAHTFIELRQCHKCKNLHFTLYRIQNFLASLGNLLFVPS